MKRLIIYLVLCLMAIINGIIGFTENDTIATFVSGAMFVALINYPKQDEK